MTKDTNLQPGNEKISTRKKVYLAMIYGCACSMCGESCAPEGYQIDIINAYLYGAPRQVTKPLRLDIHHIVAKKIGGSNAITNLIPLCEDCHRRITNLQRAAFAHPEKYGEREKDIARKLMRRHKEKLENNTPYYER